MSENNHVTESFFPGHITTRGPIKCNSGPRPENVHETNVRSHFLMVLSGVVTFCLVSPPFHITICPNSFKIKQFET